MLVRRGKESGPYQSAGPGPARSRRDLPRQGVVPYTPARLRPLCREVEALPVGVVPQVSEQPDHEAGHSGRESLAHRRIAADRRGYPEARRCRGNRPREPVLRSQASIASAAAAACRARARWPSPTRWRSYSRCAASSASVKLTPAEVAGQMLQRAEHAVQAFMVLLRVVSPVAGGDDQGRAVPSRRCRPLRKLRRVLRVGARAEESGPRS